MNASNKISFEDVFKKWEKKGEERRLNTATSYSTNSSGNNDLQTGRAAWQQRFDITALPRRRTNRKKHYGGGAFDSTDYSMTLSEQVERKFQLLSPAVEDIHRSSRPFLSTGCSKCSQKSKVMFASNKMKNSPLRNLLDLSVFCRKNFFRTAFSDVLYVANLPSVNDKKNSAEIKTAVMKSSRLSATIHKLATTNEDMTVTPELTGKERGKQTSKQLMVEAKKIINSMNGTIKGFLFKIATWVLFKLFGKIFSSIHVHQGQIQMLREASKRNIPLVYLPLHKSHLDYVFISFVLSWYGLKVPYIAAGDNLNNISLFSWLMRSMGGFFIWRRLGEHTPHNELYRVILNEYIAQILISGNSLEIFIEGTRSRTGKSYPPKIGVLSAVVSAVTEGRVSDVLIVPVNVSHEKILETGYARELLQGEQKEPETFLQTVKNVWRILRGHFGQVRTDFGLPFSLTEMTCASETSEPWQNFMKTISTNANQVSKADTASTIKSNMSEISLESLNSSAMEMAIGIAQHAIFECDQNSTIMGTNMVASLLLTKFRKGINFKEFVNANLRC